MLPFGKKINHIFTFHVTQCIVTLLAFALIASIRVLLSVGAWRLLFIYFKQNSNLWCLEKPFFQIKGLEPLLNFMFNLKRFLVS